MVAGQPTRPLCEVDRAFHELLGRHLSATTETRPLCSPETPAAREYPPARSPGASYVLCNGHLRDLFDELAVAPIPPTFLA
jgi:hypothetical protein